MMQPLIDLLHSCIVRITAPGESGAGFFITPHFLLTCAHVVHGVQHRTYIPVVWQTKEYSAQLERILPAPYPDLALLSVKEGVEGHPCVRLAEEIHLHDLLYSYGFPQGYPEGSPSDFVSEGLTGGQAPLLTFKGGEVRPGFSGSPLLNLRTGGVCGIIRLTRGQDTLMGGRAIPVSTILQHFPEIVEQQRQFHLRDRRWFRTQVEYLQQQSKNSPPQEQKIWNVPYPRKQFFTGREALLKRLHIQLRTAQASAFGQVISGLAGIGKTQLAVEYAYRHQEEYQAVLWVHAEKAETLITSYIEIARLLQLPQKDAEAQEEIVQGVKDWLSSQQNWLLILDNANEPDVLSTFLPLKVAGHILVTTQASDLTYLSLDFGHAFTVPKFTKKQDVPFLLRRAGLSQVSSQDRLSARKIADQLDGLPLALNQVGVYLARTGCSLDTYWKMYRQQRPRLLRTTEDRSYPRSVAKTFLLSFGKVEQRNPAAADLLRLCAFLAPDVIPEELLTKGARELGNVLAPVTENAYLLNQAIADLRAYSLLTRVPQTNTLTIHRLLQAVLRDMMTVQERKQWKQRIIHALHAAFPNVELQDWFTCERLMPHVFLSLAQNNASEGDLVLASLAYKAGTYFGERGQYIEGEPLYVYALSIQERLLEPQHRDIARTVNDLANLYHHQSKYEEAEQLYLRAKDFWEQQLEPEHLQLAPVLNNLANLYWTQGKYAQAEPLYKRSLAIREQQLGPQHPQLLQTLSNLATLYHQQGKYAQAESLYKRSLAIRERQLGPEHLQISYPLNGLGETSREQGKYPEAEQFFRRALDIRERQLGVKHPQVVPPLHGLANLYHEQGRYEEARQMYERVLAILEPLGSQHSWRAYPLNGLAKLCSDQKSYGEAERLFRRALQIRCQALGAQHPDTAETMHDFALLREAQGKKEKARIWYRRALAVREQALGVDHPKTTATRAQLISLLRVMGRQEEAACLTESK